MIARRNRDIRLYSIKGIILFEVHIARSFLIVLVFLMLRFYIHQSNREKEE